MRILLADDDASVRRVLQFKFKKRGYKVTCAKDGLEALNEIKRGRFDLLLSDIKMPRMDGIELLNHVRDIQPSLKVILVTAHATVSQAVQAVKLGAFDYITKPFDDDQLFVVIEKALAFGRLEKENKRLRGQLKERSGKARLFGVSQPFKRMMATIRKIAETDATVLLTGSSGTGKELVARNIHQLSLRRENDFIAINCAAIPRELLESELFGHVKGAFTSAVRDKRGKFELADGGTLLLDEIGELAIDLQAKLLRVLEEHLIEPVGSERSKEIDIRLIAATNANLQRSVASGTFREDLFYRLNVVPVHVPDLCERREDIPLLAEEFLKRFARQQDISIAPELLELLIAHRWPGNVRELENLIERMVILRSSNVLSVSDLPEDFGALDTPTQSDAATSDMSLHNSERKLIVRALVKSGWNRSRAARLLKIPRHVLIYRIKKYSISEDETDETREGSDFKVG